MACRGKDGWLRAEEKPSSSTSTNFSVQLK